MGLFDAFFFHSLPNLYHDLFKNRTSLVKSAAIGLPQHPYTGSRRSERVELRDIVWNHIGIHPGGDVLHIATIPKGIIAYLVEMEPAFDYYT